VSKRWEYKVDKPSLSGIGGKKLRRSLQDWLNAQGREGWECFYVNRDAYMFRREA
jgi:hypothetical protein